MFYLLFLVKFFLPFVAAHGYLCDPPARNSAWMCGRPDAPKNYDLNGLNAGGVATVYPNYPNACPAVYQPCGDPISGPGFHNAGQMYDIGVGKTLTGTVPIQVVITAHHKGYFDMQLCPTYPETESCFQSILKFSVEDKQQASYNFDLPLPPDVHCDRCVLRWIYVTNNSPGNAPELFINCADISIP